MISQKKYAILYCLLWLMFHMVRYFDGLWLDTLSTPFLYEPRQDPVIWVLQYFQIPSSIIGSYWLSLSMDLGLVVSVFALFVSEKFSRPTRFMWFSFIIAFWFYLLIILSFPTLSVRKYLGLALVPILFIVSERNYARIFNYLRYFVLFIFSSASIWKIVRGSVLEKDHFYNILRSQHFENLIHFPGHWNSQLVSTLLEYPGFLYFSFLSVVILQLVFLVGFFTKSYDRILLFLMVFFIILDFLIMRIEYWEFVVFLPLLYNSRSAFSGSGNDD